MALASDTPLEFHSDTGLVPDRSVPLAATAVVFHGSALGLASGYGRALVAGDPFAGFAMKGADNTAGAAGAKSVLARRRGMILCTVVGASAITDETASVYMSDDATFTLTSTSNSLIGKVEKWVSGTKCWVQFWAAGTQNP